MNATLKNKFAFLKRSSLLTTYSRASPSCGVASSARVSSCLQNEVRRIKLSKEII